MASSPGLFKSSVIFLIRILPLFSALAFSDLSKASFELIALFFDRFLRACVVLLIWSMSEGVLMLWVREKNIGSEKTRGYGVVACILGIITLVFLQAFRSQVSQPQFLLLLAALAMRGMSRGGWEQGRPQVSALTAPVSHILLALLSFYMLLEALPWQVILISISVGLLTGAVETTWNASRFNSSYPAWLLPLYRVSISLPAVIVSSMSLIRQLPPFYIVTVAMLLLSTRFTWNRGNGGDISDSRFLHLAGIYAVFVVLVVGACLCS